MKKLLSLLLLVAALSLSFAYAVPDVGDTGVDTTYSPNNNYIVCRADTQSAWVSANTGGTYDASGVCNTLGYAGADAFGGTCGDVCGYCGDNVETYDGAGGSLTRLGYTVNWRCVDFVGDDNGGDEEVPEFTVIAGVIVLLGAGAYVYRKRSN